MFIGLKEWHWSHATGLVRLNFKAYIYFCRLHIGFNIHKCCVYLRRSSWWTKLVRIIIFCWSQSLCFTIIIQKSSWVVVEGTRLMQHFGLAYKNTSPLQHSITVKCRNDKEWGHVSRLIVNEWYEEHEQVQTFIRGSVRHDGVDFGWVVYCSVSLVHDRNAEKQHRCDTTGYIRVQRLDTATIYFQIPHINEFRNDVIKGPH